SRRSEAWWCKPIRKIPRQYRYRRRPKITVDFDKIEMNRLFPAPVNRVCEEHLTLDLAKLGALPPGARRRLPALHTSDWEWQPWCNGGYVLDRTSRWASAILTRDGDTLRVSVSSS